MNIYEKLAEIQHELKAPKGQYNSFGKYKYRSCEDILEAVKPLCYKHKAVLVISDKLVVIGDRYYVEATARLTDCEANAESEDTCISNSAYARESLEKKGMDDSQITGTASSYARKYALNGLFNIDDTKDADTDEFTGNQAIDKTKVAALKKAIENANMTETKVQEILSSFNYKQVEDIKVADYMNVVNAFKEAR